MYGGVIPIYKSMREFSTSEYMWPWTRASNITV